MDNNIELKQEIKEDFTSSIPLSLEINEMHVKDVILSSNLQTEKNLNFNSQGPLFDNSIQSPLISNNISNLNFPYTSFSSRRNLFNNSTNNNLLNSNM